MCYLARFKFFRQLNDKFQKKPAKYVSFHWLHEKKIVAKVFILLSRKNLHFFRQINVFTKEVTKELMSQKILNVLSFYSLSILCELPW